MCLNNSVILLSSFSLSILFVISIELPTQTKLVELIGINEFSILLSSVTISLCWFVKMAYNVFGLGQGGDFHHKC